MNRTPLALLALVLAVPVRAQEDPRQQAQIAEAYKSLQLLAAQSRDSESKKAGSRALEDTLVAMNDGPVSGGRVASFLDKNKIDVSLAAQAEPVTAVVVNGRTAIRLSDALPSHRRVYAPLIAAEAAKLMFADMPACAERSYMIMATAARVFAEMGGEFKPLPVVDGVRVDAVKAAVGAWSVGTETELDALAQSDGVSTIPDLQAKAADAKTAAALDDADRRFVAFLNDERDARRDALLR